MIKFTLRLLLIEIVLKKYSPFHQLSLVNFVMGTIKYGTFFEFHKLCECREKKDRIQFMSQFPDVNYFSNEKLLFRHISSFLMQKNSICKIEFLRSRSYS